MIDSHCHLDCDAFDGDREAVLARAHGRGVQEVIIPAVSAGTWEPILALARRSGMPRCHAALGLHPVSLLDSEAGGDADRLHALGELIARAGAPIVAIGECGLDAAIDLERAPMARQETVLRGQLELARAHRLPVILHGRGAAAYRRLVEVLGEAGTLAAGGVLHSYSGGADLLRRLDLPELYFGFSGPATYPDARKVRASIRAVPAERLLAETDAPDQTPAPYRPGRSEPAYLPEIVAGIAAARNVDASAIATATTDNARRLFRLP